MCAVACDDGVVVRLARGATPQESSQLNFVFMRQFESVSSRHTHRARYRAAAAHPSLPPRLLALSV